MKRFACNKLFVNPQLTYPQSVVEVGDGGLFLNHFLLTEEVRGTEWLGGLFFLSSDDSLERFSPQMVWEEFLTQSVEKEGHSLYVWHLFPFDFVNNCCMPQSRLRRLC
ncbi:MAG: hypothetical protein ACRCUJ_12105 [Phocaeicola sp.]